MHKFMDGWSQAGWGLGWLEGMAWAVCGLAPSPG